MYFNNDDSTKTNGQRFVTIVGNTFHEFLYSAINVQTITGRNMENWTITGNNFETNTTGGGGIINIAGNATYGFNKSTFANNNIVSQSSGNMDCFNIAYANDIIFSKNRLIPSGTGVNYNLSNVTNAVYDVSSTSSTGNVSIANGGTGSTTQQTAINALTGTQSSGKYLRSDGTNSTLTTIQAGDVPTLNQNTTGTSANVTGVVAIANGGTGSTTATGTGLTVLATSPSLTTPSLGVATATSINGTLIPTGTATALTSSQTINAQTGTTYTFVLADGINSIVTFGSASATTVTVPTNASVAFPIGTQIDCVQVGAGKVTFSASVGVTINSQSSNLSIGAEYVGVSLIKTATNTWLLLGNLIS